MTRSAPRRRRVARLGALLLVAGVALVVLATPASAHGIGGTQPTNYTSKVLRLDPAVPGVHVATIDLGNRLELSNDTGHDVFVLGYDDEPYLRVGPRGVFENVKSPATYLNRSLTVTAAPPKSADSKAPPVWRQVSDGTVARWHDHRSHWMGSERPPAVQRDPGRPQVIERWVVPLRTGDRAVSVRGVLAWAPPPSPWPAVVAVVLLAALVTGLSRTRRWRTVLVVALSVLIVCAAVHTAGHWLDSTAGVGTTLTESLYGIVGAALGIVALGWAARRGVEAAVPLILVASVFLLVAIGLGNIATVGHSQVPSALSAPLARAVVTCAIGIGLGLTVGAALRLRGSAPPRTRRAGPPRGSRSAATVTS